MELWNIQKGMSSNDGPDSSGEGRCNCLPFDNPSAPITIQSQLREGQVRTERAAPVSTRNSVLLPAASKVIQGSTGVMRMDCVGSGAGKACRPINRCGGSLIWEIHKELGLVGVAPPVSHRRALRTFLPPMPPFTTKGILVWAQGGSG